MVDISRALVGNAGFTLFFRSPAYSSLLLRRAVKMCPRVANPAGCGSANNWCGIPHNHPHRPTNTKRGNVSGFAFKQAIIKVPAGTRTVKVSVSFLGASGANNGYLDLVSGPTSSDTALVVGAGASGVYGVTGTLAPGQSVTVVYSVAAKPYASQGYHNLVAVVTDPAGIPAQAPGSCAGLTECVEAAVADRAAVPLVNSAVAGGAAAVVLASGGVLWAVRRRATAS
ncbi:hypothetical protein P9209_01335 [Prescottella defluvii]|nr:hypothetical protein P9209_01335 [Prescottella defluvii]